MEIRSLCPLLQVFDMKTSLTFYMDVLGFQIHESAGELHDVGWVWLKRDSLDLMLNTQHELPDHPAHPEPHRLKAHSDTILYLGCPEIDLAYHELIAKGVTCNLPDVAPYGMKQLYFHDPDGYGICLQWSALQENT
jgi:catechol 2,3-dioxygenase-like lactoylglutathione lyase family enzyme